LPRNISTVAKPMQMPPAKALMKENSVMCLTPVQPCGLSVILPQ
jgi:hypothetical protein